MSDFIEHWKKEIYGSPEWAAIVKDYLEPEGYGSIEDWAKDIGYTYDPVSGLWFDEFNSSIDINVEFHDFLDALGYLE